MQNTEQGRNEKEPFDESLELLDRGTAEEFVSALIREALGHPSVHHPYLRRLSRGDFPDISGAIRDYAFQYSFYSANFWKCVEAVLLGLKDPTHRLLIEENLKEERGVPASTRLEEQPHSEMFQRFARAAGCDEAYRASNRPCATVLVWRDLFYQKCQSLQPGVAVGGMGLGTELVVPTVYRYFMAAIANHTRIQKEDYLFFPLHAVCDDGHAEHFREIAVDLAGSPEAREGLRFGVFSALNLRKAFWDVMLSRALSMERRA